MLALILNRHDTCIAFCGHKALEVASEFQPHVTVLDIGLPGLDGYQVAQRLREQPSTKGIVLVALTGYGQPEDQRRSKEAGFDYHLVKPVDSNEIEIIIHTARS